MKPETLAAINMSAEQLFESLTKDVQDVFINMVGMEGERFEPIQVESSTHYKECVTSMVGLAGTYNGLVSVHIPWQLALEFTSLMLGIEVAEINDDVNDALGEIANMIAGSFKQHLSKGGTDIMLSIPSVINGAEYEVSSGNVIENITLKFAVNTDTFTVSLTIEE